MKKALQKTEPVALPSAAREQAGTKIKEIWNRLNRRMATVQDEMRGMGHDCCQLGFYFQEATGREQLEFCLFQSIPNLPEGLPFDFAVHCVSMAKKYGPDHQFSVAEVMPELKLIFQDLKLIEAPRRDAARGMPLGMNWGTWVFKAFAPINNELKTLCDTQPPEAWPEERRSAFLAQTEQIAVTRRRLGAE